MGPQGLNPTEQLELGLAAMERRDYQAAVVPLETAVQGLPESDARIKGQMALVKAYRRTNLPGQAIALCQQLQTHANPQVSQWASGTLEKITSTPNTTGFTPTNEGAKPRRRVVMPSVVMPSVVMPSPANDRPNNPLTAPTSDAGEATVGQPSEQPPRQSIERSSRLQPSASANAPGAKSWNPLPRMNPAQLQRSAIAALLGLPLIPWGLYTLYFMAWSFWVRIATSVLKWRMSFPNYPLVVPKFFQHLVQWIVERQSWNSNWLGLGVLLDTVLCAALLWVALPWLLDLVLRRYDGLKTLASGNLSRYSDPAYRALQRGTQQARSPMPNLGVLPTAVPLILSHGTRLPNLPWTRSPQIIVSQGLIDALSDVELAALYAVELSHIQTGSTAILSWVVAGLQIPYGLYLGFADLGDRALSLAQSTSKIWATWGFILLGYLLAIVSNLSYSVFWCLRWAGLWLSRARASYGDRAAVNLTGDPNALARAIVKYAQAVRTQIEIAGETPEILERLELLLPVGYRSALAISKVNPLEPQLTWDVSNPQRHWLNLNNGTALVGDRITRLMGYGQTWQIPQEFQLQSAPQPIMLKPMNGKRLLLQGAPFWGALFGYTLATVCWLIAWLSFWVKMPQLAWLGSDFKLFIGLPMIGWGVGSILRFNDFFPDLPANWFGRDTQDAEVLPQDLLEDPLALPLDALRAVLTGKLLGRRGIANWLGQDLILRGADQSLIRLHYCTPMGILGNFTRNLHRPSDLIGQTIGATGWLRRGATLWFDLEQIRSDRGMINRGSHQIYTTILSLVLTAFGIIYCALPKDF
jgi:Zn-dependent protease with chaperone function